MRATLNGTFEGRSSCRTACRPIVPPCKDDVCCYKQKSIRFAQLKIALTQAQSLITFSNILSFCFPLLFLFKQADQY